MPQYVLKRILYLEYFCVRIHYDAVFVLYLSVIPVVDIVVKE